MFQSVSVLGSLGESPGVRGEGDDDLEPDAEPGLDVGECPLGAFIDHSELSLFDVDENGSTWGAVDLADTAEAGDTPRDET